MIDINSTHISLFLSPPIISRKKKTKKKKRDSYRFRVSLFLIHQEAEIAVHTISYFFIFFYAPGY